MADEIVTTTATDAPATITTVTTTTEVVQTDTQKAIAAVEVALVALKAAGGDYVTAEIKMFEDDLEVLKTRAKAEAETLESELKTGVTKFEIAEKTFAQKYGTAIAHGAEIILLVVLVAKVFNLI